MDKFEGAEFTLDIEADYSIHGGIVTTMIEVTVRWEDEEWVIIECPVESDTQTYAQIVKLVEDLPHPKTMEWDTYRSHGE
jgi:hypothetical protein